MAMGRPHDVGTAHMTWLNDTATALNVGSPQHPPCQHGHTDHEFQWVQVNLANQHLTVPDYPAIDPDLEFMIRAGSNAFDVLGPGYCPSNGEVSRSLLAQQCWEGYETALVVQLLSSNPRGAVIDIGSNLGWYSLIAARLGHEVLSVEADGMFLAEHMTAVHRNGMDNLWTATRAWIGTDTAPIELAGAPYVRLFKADIEGLEPEALRVFDPLFAERLVDYAVVELNPQWSGPSMHTAIERLSDYGYRLYRIPDKGHDPVAYAADPLACTLAQPLDMPTEGQTMGLFIRPGLQP